MTFVRGKSTKSARVMGLKKDWYTNKGLKSRGAREGKIHNEAWCKIRRVCSTATLTAYLRG